MPVSAYKENLMRRMLILLAVVGVLGAGANAYRSFAASQQTTTCNTVCDPTDCNPEDCDPRNCPPVCVQ